VTGRRAGRGTGGEGGKARGGRAGRGEGEGLKGREISSPWSFLKVGTYAVKRYELRGLQQPLRGLKFTRARGLFK